MARFRLLLRTALVAVPLLLQVAAGVPAPSPQDALAAAQQAAQSVPVAPLDTVCPPAAPVRSFDVTALTLPTSYNHWGDWDPRGELLVLDSQRVPLLADVAAKLEAGGLTALADATTALAQSIGSPNATRAAASLAQAATAYVAAVSTDPRTTRDFVADLVAPAAPRFDTSPLAQPLVVRAHAGECVRLRLTNLLPEAVGLDALGVASRPGAGTALGDDAPDLALPGTQRAFTFHVPRGPGVEGAHLLSPSGDARSHLQHGLFGALVVEPDGAAWLAPDGGPSESGAEAMVLAPRGPHGEAGWSDFRETVLLYHDEVELVDALARPLPLVSPLDGEYGPGTKAINLRSEPFLDRFAYAERLHAAGTLERGHDKSLAYSSYANGDPATPIARAYVGDPAKFRLVNVGPGQSHVHHLHGGGDRWRATPGAGDTQMDAGLLKANPAPESPSDRVDVQTMGPGESYNAEIEGGAGGVQQSAGDFLFHCHIVEHYLAGMWGIWRVYDTRQPGLAELPDRHQATPLAVDSLHLVGRTITGGLRLTAAALPAWVEAQLPPRGVPGSDDATVWDWTATPTPRGPLYLGEPDSTLAWPNYHSATPGERHPLLFNPDTGRLAYPFLAPHLNKRPPFAPGHGPAPHLGAETDAQHPDGLCPTGARHLAYAVVAEPATVPYNARQSDSLGEVFVLAEDLAAVRNGTQPARSLLLRANQGDCIDVLLTSNLRDGEHPAKVDIHTHLVQFDVQASDGVVTGYNFEQGIRSAASTGAGLAAPAFPGSATLMVDAPASLRPGTLVGVGLGAAGTEVRKVVSISGANVTLDAPLARAHAAGERVGPEFVRYRWYADVELGIVYWHDHVDGLNSWRHGLFGGLVVEPAGSQWCDPKRPATAAASCGAWTVRSGPVADIVASDPSGQASGRRTFRELDLELQDRGCIPVLGTIDCLSRTFPTEPLAGRDAASLNLRSEPLTDRDPAAPFASNGTRVTFGPPEAQGDPATDTLEAYVGDPTVVRLVYAGQSQTTGVATFALPGHRFPLEQDLPGSTLADRVTLGISAQKNLRLDCGAGGCGRQPGDYLYEVAQPGMLHRGAWGLLRVHAPGDGGNLTVLPSNPEPTLGPAPTGPVRHYDVVAMNAAVTTNPAPLVAPGTFQKAMRVFALAADAPAIAAGTLDPEPLVLRARPGEVVEVTLTNRLADPVSLHASLLQPATYADGGIAAGRSAATVAAPGATVTYRWLADKEVGTAYLTSYGQEVSGPLSGLPGQEADPAGQGLYGAVVVEPANSTFSPATGTASTVTLADGSTVAEQVLFYASEDHKFEASVMQYLHDVAGATLAGYRTEPVAQRIGVGGEPMTADVHPCQFDGGPVLGVDCGFNLVHAEARNPLTPWALAGPAPATPTVHAATGQPVVLRVVGAAGDQVMTHTLHGHAWAADPLMSGCRALAAGCRSNVVSADLLGTGQVHDDWIPAAGPGGAGDYLWQDGRAPFLEAGQWGLLRVG